MGNTKNRLPARLPLAIVLTAVFELSGAHTSIAAAPLQVSDCSDDMFGETLRNVIDSAPDGSTVEIPLMCSKITLIQGSIYISDNIQNMTIVGQGSALTRIDGGAPAQQGRIFLDEHFGGTLKIEGVTIANAAPYGVNAGGCIFNGGSNLYLQDVIVSDCSLFPGSAASPALGAGIYTFGDLVLADSTVTRNVAIPASGQQSRGAGIYAWRNVIVINSTISNNVGLPGQDEVGKSEGGGLFAYGGGSIFLIGSTISGNFSEAGSGMYISRYSTRPYVADILNSTIANNTSSLYAAALTDLPTYVTNSTIAFNHSEAHNIHGNSVAGLESIQTITLNNSIFASNTADSGLNIDVGSFASSNPLSGANNLITASLNGVPSGTISACPRMGHLSNNGGPTQTIPLLLSSPALNVGAANGQTTDQRGTGFPRTVGSATDIGAYERQSGVVDDVIFFSEFDSRCN